MVNVQTSLAIGWMLPRLGRFHRDRRELERLIVSQTAPDDRADWFGHAGLSGVRPRRTMTFGSSLLPAQAALHGLGIALADLALIGDHLEAGRLLVLAGLPPLVRSTGYYLAYAPGRMDDPDIQAFRQWLPAEATTSKKAAA